MRFSVLFVLSLAPLGQAGSPEYFAPAHRVSGIGIARDDISEELLKARTDLMVQSQTFSILREPLAVAGAKRITQTASLQSLFRQAERQGGAPASLMEAIAYLESWGEAKAESPAGPKGIMQISGATARTMGLRVVAATRYRISKERVLAPAKGKRKATYRTVTRKTPYSVTVRDDRLFPERAIPAASRYVAGMIQKYGSEDWAIFAYHCGQGCVAEMMELTRRARGIPKDQLTVPRMFFSNSPSWNRELYQAIQQQMQRDWSPTYYFRILRAKELLALYRRDPANFTSLAQEYRSEFVTGAQRAPHRLSVWLKRDDMVFRNPDDIRVDLGRRLVKALDRPEFVGYSLRVLPDSPADMELWSQASPSALGALAYIAFETRRLFDDMKAREKFAPLPVTALVEPEEYTRGKKEGLSHMSGQVFDVDYSGLPPAEQEALRFVLNDLGWAGYLGFVEEGRDNLHIGCSPTSREFFATVFQESLGRKGEDSVGSHE
jgi:soluble lytic murein transglycosylase-like protein